MLRTVFLLRVKVSGCCYYRRITRLKMTSHCGFAAILVVTDNLLYRTSFFMRSIAMATKKYNQL